MYLFVPNSCNKVFLLNKYQSTNCHSSRKVFNGSFKDPTKKPRPCILFIFLFLFLQDSHTITIGGIKSGVWQLHTILTHRNVIQWQISVHVPQIIHSLHYDNRGLRAPTRGQKHLWNLNLYKIFCIFFFFSLFFVCLFVCMFSSLCTLCK